MHDQTDQLLHDGPPSNCWGQQREIYEVELNVKIEFRRKYVREWMFSILQTVI